jgi:hypothetical protein
MFGNTEGDFELEVNSSTYGLLKFYQQFSFTETFGKHYMGIKAMISERSIATGQVGTKA